MTNRIGDWIQTYTGRKVYPLDLNPDEIAIEDIAHALSNLCRFTGHCRSFYSVAQHSVYVSLSCEPVNALVGLLHDAPEAYLTDLPRPLKRMGRLGEAYRQAEELAWTAVAERFGLSIPIPSDVDRADMVLLATEARDLMSPLHAEWHYQEANGYPVLPYTIKPVFPDAAKTLFLARYAELTRAA
jgi:5'-deoxynucleotidase YfbR-like HD superfamily hydrolase